MKNKGFTLIELLIAILIFSIVIVAIYSTFSTGLIVWKKGEESSRLYQEARLALNKMALELRNAHFYSNIKFAGEANRLSFATLLSSPSPEENAQLQLYQVTYYLDDNQTLRRRAESLPALLQGNTGEAKELASSVRELNFSYGYEYYEEGVEEPQFIWKDKWTEEKTIPSLVKITLVLQDEKNPPGKIAFTRTVPIPSGVIGIIIEEK